MIPNQLFCHFGNILLNETCDLHAIITCFLTGRRIELLPKMNELNKAPTINIIFTITDLKSPK